MNAEAVYTIHHILFGLSQNWPRKSKKITHTDIGCAVRRGTLKTSPKIFRIGIITFGKEKFKF